MTEQPMTTPDSRELSLFELGRVAERFSGAASAGDWVRKSADALLAHIALQAERLAEAERVATYYRDWHTRDNADVARLAIENTDLAEKLAAKDATIAEMRTALETIKRHSTHSYHWEGSMREEEVHNDPCAKCVVEAALAAAPSNADGKEE